MTMIRRIFTFMLLLQALTLASYAVPTNPRPFTVKQPDGTLLQVRFVGDENYSYFATLDGVPLVQENGAYYYASIKGQQLSNTEMLAHEQVERKVNEKNYIENHCKEVRQLISDKWSVALNERNEQRFAQVQAHRVRQKAFGHPTTYEGNKRGIVILVNYADLNMKSTSTREAWDDQFNKPGYNKNNHIGSVRDYFLDQSYQKLTIDFDVVGPYTVSQPWRYYGKNRGGTNTDIHPCQLVTEACKLANADVNFADYDWDGDGEVDQVFVVYAGYSAASGYDEDAIWPHEWHLSYGTYYGDGNGALRLDGVKIDTYALSSELQGTSGTTMDCIGTAVHEFSHCLGLPDFYDVEQAGTQCMDYWDVLDAGCYSGPNWKGEVPTGYSAYERNFAGWLKFEELTEPCKVSNLEDLGDAPHAYIHYNKGNKNEYFILENRQAKGWFKYPVSAHGLFVYHVDYDRTAWENDRPNGDPSHPRMVYVPADKSYSVQYTNHMMSDFFPGTGKVTSLTNTSHTSCNGKMFNRNSDGTYNTNMELTSITEKNGLISFNYNGGDAVVKNALRSLILDSHLLIEIPHVEITEGANNTMQDAISQAEEAVANGGTSADFKNALIELRQQAVDFIAATYPTDSLRPYDITFAFDNPAITSNAAWTDETANNAFTYANSCGEYKGIKFNLSQTSTVKLPKGNYTATCQAFQRPGKIETAAKNTVTTSFYAKLKSVKVKNIVNDAVEKKKVTSDVMLEDSLYVPNDQRGAHSYFNAGLYLNTVQFSHNPSAGGATIKLGLRNSIAKDDYWTCFANFKLYYHGDQDATDIQSVTSSTTETNKLYDILGRPFESGRPLTPGLYIRNGKKVLINK